MTYVAQEGGTHYQAVYQHWDWVIDARLGYLDGNATKYIARHRKKNGLQDLLKAKTYAEKLKMNFDGLERFRYIPDDIDAINERFFSHNDLYPLEREVCQLYSKWKLYGDVILIGTLTDELIEIAKFTLELPPCSIGQGASTSTSTGVVETNPDLVYIKSTTE